MSYLSASAHAALRANPDSFMPYLYTLVRQTFINDLGSGFQPLGENMLKAMFCSVIAFDAKPYGGSGAKTVAECLADSVLDCDNYCSLAMGLRRILAPGTPDPHVVGWNNGSVGNHAQMLLWYDGVATLADPTIGLLVRDFTLTGMCRGYPPSHTGKVKSFWDFNADRTNLTSFDARVKAAVNGGTYYADHLLYYFRGLDAFHNAGPVAHWATPQSPFV